MKSNLQPTVLIFTGLCTAISSATASLTTYDLTSDFSTTANPNGVWSYEMNGAPITQPLNFGVALGWGYNPVADSSILQSVAAGWGQDVQVGDIVMHAPSQYNGPGAFLDFKWTSPASGTISISGKAWAASFYADRDANWTLSVGGTDIASRAGVYGVYRSDSAAQFDSNLLPGGSLTGINVTAGEVVEFTVKTDTVYGHFVGVQESITLNTSVPEPSTCIAGALLLLPFGVSTIRKLHKKQAS